MILLTGASGQLASLVAAKARAAGLPFLTASRSPTADRPMDFDKPETLDFAGISTLFLVSAGYGEDDVVIRRHGAILRAARRDGVVMSCTQACRGPATISASRSPIAGPRGRCGKAACDGRSYATASTPS